MYGDVSKFRQLFLKVGAAPATPAAGYFLVYSKTGPTLNYKNDAGVEFTVADVGQVQQDTAKSAVAGGTANAITATLSPVPVLTDMMRIFIRASGGNTITNPTLNVNGLGALPITKYGGSALAVGDIAAAGQELTLAYRASVPRWELLNPAQAVAAIPGGEQISEPVNALATSGAIAINLALGDYFTLGATGNLTSFTFSNLPAAGKAQTIMIAITQDATGSRVATWPASFKWPAGSAGVLSTAANAKDLLALTTFDQGTTWYATLTKAFA